MPRATYAVARHQRKNRLMKSVKGYRGGRSKLLRTAKETYARALRYAFEGRRDKKGDFRRLWITRITAALRGYDMLYSRFIHALKNLNIQINRKELSEMAIADTQGFAKLVELAKQNLATAVAK